MPFTQIRPQQFRIPGVGERARIAGHFWVPINDENCMVWNWVYSFGDEPLTEEDRLERGSGNGPDHVDQKTFRSFRNKGNNWLIDRQVQKTETFSGIDGINTQDRATQESMGRYRREATRKAPTPATIRPVLLRRSSPKE
jgi:hypothetical protein